MESSSSPLQQATQEERPEPWLPTTPTASPPPSPCDDNYQPRRSTTSTKKEEEEEEGLKTSSNQYTHDDEIVVDHDRLDSGHDDEEEEGEEDHDDDDDDDDDDGDEDDEYYDYDVQEQEEKSLSRGREEGRQEEPHVPEMPMEFYDNVDRFLALPPPTFSVMIPTAPLAKQKPAVAAKSLSKPALPSINQEVDALKPIFTLRKPTLGASTTSTTKKAPAGVSSSTSRSSTSSHKNGPAPHAIDQGLLAEAFAYADRLALQHQIEQEAEEEAAQGHHHVKGKMKKTKSQPSTQMMFALTTAGGTMMKPAGVHHPVAGSSKHTTSTTTNNSHHHARRNSEPLPKKSMSSSSLLNHLKPRHTPTVARQSTLASATRKQQLSRSRKALVHGPPPPAGRNDWSYGSDQNTDKCTGMRQEEFDRMVQGFESQMNIQQLRRELEESQASMERSEAVLRTAARDFYNRDFKKAFLGVMGR